ncbi:MAG: FAD-binding protein [Candidatus Latescibacteria bacterium]|nr:FAD-binding protein [Candidatus Latescibacterota bacterium]
MTERLVNWAGNHPYRAAGLQRPESIDQVRQLVRQGQRLKVLGTRHSFNDIADTTGTLISLEGLEEMEIDAPNRRVTVTAGTSYGHLCPHLHGAGLALPNMASLPHISIAGACATATHGSGVKNGNLATAVAALEMVTANGDLVQLSRQADEPHFAGSVVGLGALGAVTRLTLNLLPAFDMRQDVYTGLTLDELSNHFDAIMADAYSVCLFTDWQSRQFRAWVKRRLGEETAFFTTSASADPQHPIAGTPTNSCTEQRGVPGPWHLRLPHFRMDSTPSLGEELQSEYFVPRQRAVEALLAIDALRDKIAPLLHVSEIRAVAADDLWMSPCYQRDSIAIHFTWKKDWPGVQALLPRIETALTPFQARPHWGKLFTLPPAHLQELYPRLADFRALARQYDPTGKFRNDFLDTYILTADDSHH